MSQGAEREAPAPGTGESPEPTPPAEAQKTEGSGPPESIPYARFKEVNDALKPFKELEEFGYSADDLRQLAEWDTAFQTDPAGTWLSIAQQMENMPDEVKEAVMRHLNGSETESQPTPEAPKEQKEQKAEEEPPAWAREILDWKSEQQQAQEDADFDQMLDEVVNWWQGEDKKQGITTPEKQILSFVMSHASREYDTIEAMQEAARSDRLALREVDLKPVTERPGSPVPVPGGGALPPNPPPPPKTLSEASKMARRAIEAAQREEE